MVHELKTLPEYFDSVQKLQKNFEVRKNDRPFDIGDFVALNEWSKDTGYTGRCMLLEITYILDDPNYCKDGFVILGLIPRGIPGGNYVVGTGINGVIVYDRKAG